MVKKWLEKRLTVEKKINGIRSKMWMSFFHLSNLIKSKKKVYSVDKPQRLKITVLKKSKDVENV